MVLSLKLAEKVPTSCGRSDSKDVSMFRKLFLPGDVGVICVVFCKRRLYSAVSQTIIVLKSISVQVTRTPDWQRKAQ